MYQDRLMRQLWLALIEDTTDTTTAYFFRQYFSSTKSTISLISDADNYAEHLVVGTELANPYNKWGKLGDILPSIRLDRRMYSEDEIALALQLLRFPKRFTPESEVASSISKFWETNARLHRLEFNSNSLLIKTMRYWVTKWLSNYNASHYSLKPSTGADLENHKSTREKIQFLESIDPTIMGYFHSGTVSFSQHQDMPHNKLISVPKNWKTRRNIAKESQWTTNISTPIADELTNCLPEMVSVDDQDRNQLLAYRGSIDNSLATLDLSAASDSVSLLLCREILPWNIYREILRATAVCPDSNCYHWTHTQRPYIIGTERYKGHGYQMVSTMGNRITFPLEELVFAAVVATAFTFCSDSWEYYIDSISIFGDDIIVPTWIAETVIDILTACGFVVNVQKSFYHDEFYRESCGKEYYHGIDISSLYWPRRVVNKDYATLIGMQHKFYSYPHMNKILCQEIRSIFPKVTESLPDSPYDDIWDNYPNITRAYGSYDRIHSPESGEVEPSCEIHTTLCLPVIQEKRDELNDRYNYTNWLKNPDRLLSDDPVLSALGYRDAADRSTIDRRMASDDVIPLPKNRKYLI